MRLNRNSNHLILKQVFGRRLTALEAINRALTISDASSIKSAASDLRTAAETVGDGPAADGYRVYAALAEIGGLLVSWTQAIKTAEQDADRYLRAAKENTKQLLSVFPTGLFWRPHLETAKSGAQVTTPEQAAAYLAAIMRLPLPIPLVSHPKHEKIRPRMKTASPRTVVEPQVFLEFSLDGHGFANPQIVAPGEMRDLSVKVKVKNWPEAAERLWIHPTSVEPAGIYSLPEFEIKRPKNTPDGEWKLDGRLNINVRQKFTARPLEFCYRADFQPDNADGRPIVSGNGRLIIQSHDLELSPMSGYREVDKKLVELRDIVRSTVIIDDNELTSFLTIMRVLGRTAGQALQNADFTKKLSEADFQKHMIGVLRLDPEIGSQLEEHPYAAGGITDLSFQRIRIELKVEDTTLIALEDAKRYTGQTAQYVAGTDRRLGVLCILDCSPKAAAPGLVTNDIGIIHVPPPTGNGVPITVGVVLIRGNLPKPSKLSRSKKRKP